MAEKRIYVDTNVYIDYFANRSDNLRPLGELAFQLFERALSCEFKIIISSHVIKELEKYNYGSQIKNAIEEWNELNKVEFIKANNNDFEKASKNKGISHYEDRLHYVLAERANAELLITRNWKDFCGLGDIPVLIPEYA